MRIAVYNDDGTIEYGFTFNLKHTSIRDAWYVVQHAINLMITEDKKK